MIRLKRMFHFRIPYGIAGDIKGRFVCALEENPHSVTKRNDGTMACRHMLKSKTIERQRRFRQNPYILESGFFKNGCILFILHKDRNGFIQRLTYGPIGSYINMVWMDVRYDVIIDAIQNFLRCPRQSINRHGNFHFNRIWNHVRLPRNISETTKTSFSTKPWIN